MNYFKKQKKSLLVGLLLLVAMAAGVIFLVSRHSTISPQQDMQRTVTKVGHLISLPKGEEPTLVTVQDKSKVTDPFLKAAENGDKILLYPIAKKVYIFRPSTGKLIDVGPLTVDPSAAELKNTRIVIRNGSGDETKYNGYKMSVMNTYGITPTDQGGARRSDYPATIIIDVTQNSQKYDLVSDMISKLGAERGVLPNGELAPTDADILIIVGKN